MEMIQAVLDGSATPEELEHMKSEMEMCLPCIEGYEEYKTLKKMLVGNVEKKKCPEQTISSIKATIGVSLIVLSVLLIRLF